MNAGIKLKVFIDKKEINMKIEKLEITEQGFLKTLPKLKKYKPVLTANGLIRFGKRKKDYAMCPLTAYRKEVTGVAGNLYLAGDYFTNYDLTTKIVCAADNTRIQYLGFRKKMLKALGL